jgi:hypothetical protein
MTWVLDASAALAWVFERSNADEAACALAHLERLAVEGAVVPEFVAPRCRQCARRRPTT